MSCFVDDDLEDFNTSPSALVSEAEDSNSDHREVSVEGHLKPSTIKNKDNSSEKGNPEENSRKKNEEIPKRKAKTSTGKHSLVF